MGILLLLLFVVSVSCTSHPREISVSIPEELEVNHEVATIAMEEEPPYVDNKKVIIDYQFFSSPSTERFFSLHPKTGRIAIRRKIDRDGLCSTVATCCPNKAGSRGQCVLNLSVRSDMEYSFVYLIKVKVTDINDNAPRWAQSEITAQFSEASDVGDYRSISTAVDADSGPNSVQRYEMRPALPAFQLEYLRSGSGLGGGNGGELRLKLQQQLDRESKKEYEFTLFAVDGGETARTGSVKVRVIVTDENDNKPVFDQKAYTATIEENIKSSEKVMKLSATDRDDGQNGRVEFRISSLTKPEVRRLFSIDTITGMIRVQGNIDYEQHHALKLLIEASDRGATPRKSLVTVDLKVTDKNDNFPRVHLQSSTGSLAMHNNLAQIKENRPVGTLVAAFSVDDADSGPNGKVSCKLKDNSYFGLRSMNIPDTVMYRLQTAAVLDREEVALHRVIVQCEDEGVKPLTSTTTMNVRVLDQNDERPRFSPEHYFQNVREDLRVGAFVFTLNASDRDDGNNGLLNYWIGADKPTPFKVERLTGKVRLHEQLDREKQDRITFVVYAHDLGEPERKTGSATVSVTVTDANDNSPLLNALYYFSIPENATTGSHVGFINATDRDEGRNAQLSYNLVPLPGETVRAFHITPQGRLIVMSGSGVLDREEKATHKFLVRVSDNGRPRRSSSATVTVTLTDVNDNAPVFVFPRKGNHTLFVSHRARSGELIGKVVATDKDDGKNNLLSYYLRPDSRGATPLFQLDPTSGELRLDRDLRPEDVRLFHLLVTARDNGQIPKSNVQLLKVKVQRPATGEGDRGRPPRKAGNDLMGQNLIVIIALVGVTAVFVLVLISAILVLSCRRRNGNRRRPPEPGVPGASWEQKEQSKTLKMRPSDPKWPDGQQDFSRELDPCQRDLTVLAVGPDGASMVSVDPSCVDVTKAAALDQAGGREETVYQALSKFNTNIRNSNLNTTDDIKRSLKHHYETLVQDEENEYDAKTTLRPQPGAKLFDDRLSPIDEANAGQRYAGREMEYFYDNQSSTLKKKKNPYQPVMGASFV